MNRNLNVGWLLATIALALIYAACRLITWNTNTPVWAATLQSIVLMGAFVCAFLMGGTGFSLRNLERSDANRARRSLIVGAIVLLILPFVIYLVYQRYYADLLSALKP